MKVKTASTRSRSRVRRKSLAALVSIRFVCREQEFDLLPDRVTFIGGETPCDVCGAHGEVEAIFACPICGQLHTTLLASW